MGLEVWGAARVRLRLWLQQVLPFKLMTNWPIDWLTDWLNAWLTDWLKLCTVFVRGQVRPTIYTATHCGGPGQVGLPAVPELCSWSRSAPHGLWWIDRIASHIIKNAQSTTQSHTTLASSLGYCFFLSDDLFSGVEYFVWLFSFLPGDHRSLERSIDRSIVRSSLSSLFCIFGECCGSGPIIWRHLPN